jgi:hypothetical protein
MIDDAGKVDSKDRIEGEREREDLIAESSI